MIIFLIPVLFLIIVNCYLINKLLCTHTYVYVKVCLTLYSTSKTPPPLKRIYEIKMHLNITQFIYSHSLPLYL